MMKISPVNGINFSSDFEGYDERMMAMFVSKFDSFPSKYQVDDIAINHNFLDMLVSDSLNSTFIYATDKEQIKLNMEFSSVYDYAILEYEGFFLRINFCGKFEHTKKLTRRKGNVSECCLMFYYNERNKEEFCSLLKELEKNVKNLPTYKTDNSISLVQRDSNGFKLVSYEIKKTIIDIELSYGKKFVEIDKEIIETLVKNYKGLWVFHGIPGSGKTSYIKNLLERLNALNREVSNDIRIIYMSAEMVKTMDDPGFLPFISKFPGSILILEDADVALESRNLSGHIVNTVLNLTDGILADCLQIKIIATFNCDLSKIDSALLRKGRLVKRHNFGYLSLEEATKMAAHLKLDQSKMDQSKSEWTLADVYGIEEDFDWEDNKNNKIGFNQN